MMNPRQFAAFPHEMAVPAQTDAYPTKRGFRGKLKSDNNNANERVTYSVPFQDVVNAHHEVSHWNPAEYN